MFGAFRSTAGTEVDIAWIQVCSNTTNGDRAERVIQQESPALSENEKQVTRRLIRPISPPALLQSLLRARAASLCELPSKVFCSISAAQTPRRGNHSSQSSQRQFCQDGQAGSHCKIGLRCRLGTVEGTSPFISTNRRRGPRAAAFALTVNILLPATRRTSHDWWSRNHFAGRPASGPRTVPPQELGRDVRGIPRHRPRAIPRSRATPSSGSTT